MCIEMVSALVAARARSMARYFHSKLDAGCSMMYMMFNTVAVLMVKATISAIVLFLSK